MVCVCISVWYMSVYVVCVTENVVIRIECVLCEYVVCM